MSCFILGTIDQRSEGGDAGTQPWRLMLKSTNGLPVWALALDKLGNQPVEAGRAAAEARGRRGEQVCTQNLLERFSAKTFRFPEPLRSCDLHLNICISIVHGSKTLCPWAPFCLFFFCPFNLIFSTFRLSETFPFISFCLHDSPHYITLMKQGFVCGKKIFWMPTAGEKLSWLVTVKN